MEAAAFARHVVQGIIKREIPRGSEDQMQIKRNHVTSPHTDWTSGFVTARSVAAFSCLFSPNFKSNLVHLLNSTWAQIGRQRLNAFWHANVVKMTCQSSNWAPEWGRKGIQVTLSVAWFVDVRLAGFSIISKAADQLGFLSTTSRD